MKTLVFEKKLGFHRDAPRLYFQTTDLNDYGFVPGARYDANVYGDGHIGLRLNPEGRRAVCKKVVGDRTLSIIDLNGKVLMSAFVDMKKVLVTVRQGVALINPIKEA